MGKKVIIGLTGLLIILMITGGFVITRGKSQKEPQATPTAAAAPAPAAPRRVVFTPINPTAGQIDACKVSVMANPENRLSERKAHRIASGTSFKTKDGMIVTVTDSGGIWNGCKAALADPQRAQLATAKALKLELGTDVTTLTKESQEAAAALAKAQQELAAVNTRIASLEQAIANRAPAPAAGPAPAPQPTAPPAPAAAAPPAKKN